MIETVNGSTFKQMVLFGAACIASQKQEINDLNVFPVPDGDTGTNMSLTISTAVDELKKHDPATVDEAAHGLDLPPAWAERLRGAAGQRNRRIE